jgi:hypothetical protein
MSRKSGHRFSEKDMRKCKNLEAPRFNLTGVRSRDRRLTKWIYELPLDCCKDVVPVVRHQEMRAFAQVVLEPGPRKLAPIGGIFC